MESITYYSTKSVSTRYVREQLEGAVKNDGIVALGTRKKFTGSGGENVCLEDIIARALYASNRCPVECIVEPDERLNLELWQNDVINAMMASDNALAAWCIYRKRHENRLRLIFIY